MKRIFLKIRKKISGEVSTEKLKKFGLQVGENFHRQEGCIIDYSHCWLIKIGDNVTLAPRVHILAHDSSTKNLLGYTKIGCVNIGNNVFVGANTIILPNVTIGNNVIIGAGSVVNRDVKENSVVAGNPAKIICDINQYIEKNKKLLEETPKFNENWTLRNGISDKNKLIMKEKLFNSIGFVK